MTRSLLSSVAVSTLVLASGHAAPIIIDTFSKDQAPVSGPATSFIDDPGILGGETEASFLGGSVEATFESAGGQATLSDVMNTDALNFQLIYDGDDSSSSNEHEGLGGIDITAGGMNDRFKIEMPSMTGEFNVRVNVYTSSANYAAATLFIDSPGTHEILFTSLMDISGTLDFTDVGFISFWFSVEQGDSFTVEEIRIDNDGTVVPDTAAPTITFLGKKALKKEKTAHTVKGRVTDASAVAKVEVKVPRSPWKKARLKPTGKWTFSARDLKKGNNRLKVRATDTAGNRSKVKKVVVMGK